MQNAEIYFSEDSELSEYEAVNKGYRHDVFVKMNQSIYHVFVYTLIRLQQDFETEMDNRGFYAVKPNLILVRNTDKYEIMSTINFLIGQDFFSNIKESSNINIIDLIKVQ